jgi:hypothetical protein
MKIVPDVEDPAVESGLCDLDRMAEIVKYLLINLTERFDAKDVPDAFMADLEGAIFAASQMRDMVAALKVEYYAEYEAQNSKLRRIA